MTIARRSWAWRQCSPVRGEESLSLSSGREALRCLLREDFSLILMDVRMPDMDGFETADLIRQNNRLRHIPIIFLSAIDTLETDVYRGRRKGCRRLSL